MIDRGWRAERLQGALVAVALVLAVSACTGASPSPSPSLAPSASASVAASTASSSPSAAASVFQNTTPTSSSNLFSLLPAVQPADFVPKIACTGSIGPSDPVALVELLPTVEGNNGELVLRDYADVTKPRTACTLPARVEQLIDARHIVIAHNRLLAVVDLPELRYHWFHLPDSALPELAYRQFLAVGPNLDQVLWMITSGDAGTDTIHLSTSAGDQVIATLPTPGRGRCGSAESDSNVAAYTHSGSHLFVLNQPIPDFNSLVVVAGETTVLMQIPQSTGWPPSGAIPAMALWSPTSARLYYRQGSDVWTWTAGSNPQVFLAGVAWVQPTISGDGTHLAYSVLRPDGGLHDVFLVDLAQGGSPQKIGAGPRKMPAFVNSTQLYFRSEGDDHGCAGAELEKPLIYNIVDGSEARSIFEGVRYAWPSTSSNH